MNILTCAGTAKADGRPSPGRRKGWVLLGLCTLWPALAGAQQDSSVSATAVQLTPVKVQGHAESDGTTEGTSSYTSDSSNTSTRLRLAPRETPQSVSIMTRQRMDDQGLTQLTDVIVQTPGLILDGGGNMGSDSSPIYARGFQVDNYQIDGVGLNYTG